MDLKNDWEFNVLQVYNYRKPGPLSRYFKFIREYHDRIEGDICEVGVFRGASLLATAMLLKELGSTKLVYGFDTFSGFPGTDNPADDLAVFDKQFEENRISKEHIAQVRRNLEFRKFMTGSKPTPATVSSSGTFADTSEAFVKDRADYLGLDNIQLVPGRFEDTMVSKDASPSRICCALIDCDLYDGYRTSLPFVWHRLQRGGYLFLDEYYSLKFPGARDATDRFFADKLDRPQRHETESGEFERWFVQRLSE